MSEPKHHGAADPSSGRADFTQQARDRYLTTFYSDVNGVDGNEMRDAAAAYEREIGDYLPKDRGAPILEIGSGGGGFLWLCRQRGYADVRGIDISPEQVEFCHSQGLTEVETMDAFDYLPATSMSFDLIVMMDVIEHMDKSRALAVLQAARDRLREGGRIVVRVPNMSNPFNLRNRYVDLTHELGFSIESLKQMFRLADLEIESIYDTGVPQQSWVNRLVFDVLLWKAFRAFYKRTMKLSNEIVRGKNLIGVATLAHGVDASSGRSLGGPRPGSAHRRA